MPFDGPGMPGSLNYKEPMMGWPKDTFKLKKSQDRIEFATMLGAHIIVNGGAAKSHDDILRMHVGDLIDLLSPNGITLEVNNERVKNSA